MCRSNNAEPIFPVLLSDKCKVTRGDTLHTDSLYILFHSSKLDNENWMLVFGGKLRRIRYNAKIEICFESFEILGVENQVI